MADEFEAKRIINLPAESAPADGDVFVVDNETTGTKKLAITGLIDAKPTQGSNRAVSSGGMYTSLENKSDKKSTPGIVTPEETEVDLYICDSDGNVIVELKNGHLRTKYFDSSNIDIEIDPIIKETSQTDADLYICDSFGHVIGEFINGHIRTKNFNSADMEGIPEDLSALQINVSALQSATSGIIYRNRDATDGVYAACRWHQPTISSKQFCLLIAGDIHHDDERMNNIITYLNAIDAFDAGIMLGDIAGDTSADITTYYNDAVSHTQKPFLTLIGNHDIKGTSTAAEIYNKYIAPNIQYAELASGEHTAGKCYYYKDFSVYGIRLIVLDQYEYPDNDSNYTRGIICYSQDQINWLIETLNSTPADYGVIVAVHAWAGAMTREADNILTAPRYNGSPYSPEKLMDGYVIPDIINAWVNGTTLSATYTYTPSGAWTTLNVSADFTSRGAGEFITYIGGHWHMSVLAHCTAYTYQKSYNVDCANAVYGIQSDTPRRIGTRSEDCFCALAVDRDAKTVKVFRVGAHFTKDAVNRLYGEYSYGGTE